MPLQIIRQDITKMNVDAIVNTTNEEMVGYSGVDLAIHTAAGAELDEACRKIAPLGLGEVKITYGYNLPCRYVIHTSGPIWEGGLRGEKVLLRSCYIESLKLAVQYDCKSIALPLISSGVYGYPKDQVLKFAIKTVSEFLAEHDIDAYICVFDKESYVFSQELFEDIQAFIDDDYADELLDNWVDDIADMCSTYPNTAALESGLNMTDEKSRQNNFDNSIKGKTLFEYLKAMDRPFAYKLFTWIDIKGMTDVECYKKANVDKKTFSKIKCNPKTYKPSKHTAVAFAIALELNLEETQDLLASAGMTLSRSFTFDKIIRYFIQKGNYNIFEINEALFEFDQVLLGCVE